MTQKTAFSSFCPNSVLFPFQISIHGSYNNNKKENMNTFLGSPCRTVWRIQCLRQLLSKLKVFLMMMLFLHFAWEHLVETILETSRDLAKKIPWAVTQNTGERESALWYYTEWKYNIFKFAGNYCARLCCFVRRKAIPPPRPLAVALQSDTCPASRRIADGDLIRAHRRSTCERCSSCIRALTASNLGQSAPKQLVPCSRVLLEKLIVS
jgi:hypothetical protein